jgi:hypothetical protein
MYVQCISMERWRKYFSSEKATIHFVSFPHYLKKGAILRKKKLLNVVCVLIFSATFRLKHFSF